MPAHLAALPGVWPSVRGLAEWLPCKQAAPQIPSWSASCPLLAYNTTAAHCACSQPSCKHLRKQLHLCSALRHGEQVLSHLFSTQPLAVCMMLRPRPAGSDAPQSPSTLESFAPTCLHDAASQEAGVPCLLLQIGLHPSQPRKFAAHAPLEGVLLTLQQKARQHSEDAKASP